jgi:hypothetical protein
MINIPNSSMRNWIQRQNKLKNFVAHRVNEIVKYSDPLDWNYVPSKQNPADYGTRCLKPEKISDKWTTGPPFLNGPPNEWPKRPQTTCTVITVEPPPPVFDNTRFSSWNKLLKVAANVFRFIRRVRLPLSSSSLTPSDFRKADAAIIKQSQSQSFTSTIHQLRHNRNPSHRDKLVSFRPFLDEDCFLRSHGRLAYAPLSPDCRNPILLDSKEPFAKLYLQHAHELCCHAGPEHVKAFVQQRFKVLGIRTTLRSISYNCFICRRFRATSVQPLMAPLPNLRFPSLESPFPFEKTGVDLFGSFFKVNGRKTEKHYGVIFNCLVTRACHLESCSIMTTDSFLNAFRCFIARRGQPRCPNSKTV